MPIINVEVQKKAPNQNKHTPLAAPFLYFYCELILYLLFIIIYHYVYLFMTSVVQIIFKCSH